MAQPQPESQYKKVFFKGLEKDGLSKEKHPILATFVNYFTQSVFHLQGT